MLEVKNISGGYPEKTVLHDISLNAPAGQITAILGPNGCGKSTLLRSVCGILPVSAGQILLDGQDIRALPQNEIAQRVAYLSQNRQVPDITVGRLVLHGRFPYLRYPRRYRQIDYAIAQTVMSQMGILELADTPMKQLSGGQRQKAYIAMALAQDTNVVLFDEPTTYLDVSYQFQVLRQARALADSGTHVLMVIHDLSNALEAADQAVVMEAGTVVMQGTPEEVYRAGVLDKVFGVQVKRIKAENHWHYFCVEKTQGPRID